MAHRLVSGDLGSEAVDLVVVGVAAFMVDLLTEMAALSPAANLRPPWTEQRERFLRTLALPRDAVVHTLGVQALTLEAGAVPAPLLGRDARGAAIAVAAHAKSLLTGVRTCPGPLQVARQR